MFELMSTLTNYVFMMYAINVAIYISMDKGGNNELIKLVESKGFPRHKFIIFFQNSLFISSIIMSALMFMRISGDIFDFFF